MTIQNVTVPRGPIHLAGQLHLPDDFDETTRSPAIVMSTPGSSVKEQIGANYASRLAKRGFVAIAVDPAYQGQSEGVPRDLEDPYARGEDLRATVDFLATLGFVDEDRIGLLGVCAGGGYAVHTAMTEHRFKALSTVVPVNIGRAFRQAGTAPGAVLRTLEAVGRQRTAEARGGDQLRQPWIPDSVEQAREWGITDIDVLQAVRYYRTERGHNDNSTNRRLFRGDALILGYDAFHLASELLIQPLQVIVAGRQGTTGSYADGMQLWEIAPNAQSLHVVDGAGHYEMYDEPKYVDEAVRQIDAFFSEQIAA